MEYGEVRSKASLYLKNAACQTCGCYRSGPDASPLLSSPLMSRLTLTMYSSTCLTGPAVVPHPEHRDRAPADTGPDTVHHLQVLLLLLRPREVHVPAVRHALAHGQVAAVWVCGPA